MEAPWEGEIDLLRINNLNVFYGQIHALKGVSLEINAGEIVTLIGNNGAGKSTMQKSIAGLLKPQSGEIIFENQHIEGLPAYKIASMGICLVPEGRKIFSTLTVHENLELGAYLRKDKGEIAASFDRVYQLFPILKERYKQLGGTLSGGQQQMLAISRGLMANPKIMLLDEPSLGLAPKIVEQIADTIIQIQKEGIPILLVEQNAMMSLSICERAYVLETGRILISGKGCELMENEEVQKAYLGL